MTDPPDGFNEDGELDNQTLLENYVPGSSLASVDAKIAQLDAMFKNLCKSAGR